MVETIRISVDKGRRNHYYDELEPVDIDNLDQLRCASYPYVCSFKDADNTVINFEYKCRLLPNKLLFLVEPDKNEQKTTFAYLSSLQRSMARMCIVFVMM